MMSFTQSMILGAIQGLTEFLPVSSSGHLVLAKALMHISTGNGISYEVFLHFGTLISVVIVFRAQIKVVAGAMMLALREPSRFMDHYRNSEAFRLGMFVFIGCIPAGVFGVMFNDRIEEMFDDPKLVADMLLITGTLLFFTRFAKPSADGVVTLGRSIGIGCAQAVAVIPGISRSGSTISTALLLGVAPAKAAEFSFLMALPVIFGATLIKARHLIMQPPPAHDLQMLAVGTVVAFVTGYFSLRFLLAVLRSGKFSVFAYYCFIAGILGILFVE